MAAYPRKQTVVIFAICAVAVSGVAYYSYGLNKGAGGSIGDVVAVTPITSGNNDWQKAFLGLNATTTTAYKPTTQQTATQKDQPLTPIDQLGQNFFTKYAELKQAGLTTDPQTVDSAMSQVAADSADSIPSPKVYSLSDFVVVGSNTTALNAYGKSVLLAFNTYLPKQNEAEVANKAFEDNDMTELANIDTIIASYKNTLKYLAGIAVPQPLAQYHLSLLNGISIGLYNAESFRHMDVDPMRSLAAIGLETIGLENISNAFSKIQSYFVSAGVPLG